MPIGLEKENGPDSTNLARFYTLFLRERFRAHVIER